MADRDTVAALIRDIEALQADSDYHYWAVNHHSGIVVDGIFERLKLLAPKDPWPELLEDPEFRAGMDRALEDIEAGRVRPWADVKREWREQEVRGRDDALAAARKAVRDLCLSRGLKPDAFIAAINAVTDTSPDPSTDEALDDAIATLDLIRFNADHRLAAIEAMRAKREPSGA